MVKGWRDPGFTRPFGDGQGGREIDQALVSNTVEKRDPRTPIWNQSELAHIPIIRDGARICKEETTIRCNGGKAACFAETGAAPLICRAVNYSVCLEARFADRARRIFSWRTCI